MHHQGNLIAGKGRVVVDDEGIHHFERPLLVEVKLVGCNMGIEDDQHSS